MLILMRISSVEGDQKPDPNQLKPRDNLLLIEAKFRSRAGSGFQQCYRNFASLQQDGDSSSVPVFFQGKSHVTGSDWHHVNLLIRIEASLCSYMMF